MSYHSAILSMLTSSIFEFYVLEFSIWCSVFGSDILVYCSLPTLKTRAVLLRSLAAVHFFMFPCITFSVLMYLFEDYYTSLSFINYRFVSHTHTIHKPRKTRSKRSNPNTFSLTKRNNSKTVAKKRYLSRNLPWWCNARTSYVLATYKN